MPTATQARGRTRRAKPPMPKPSDLNENHFVVDLPPSLEPMIDRFAEARTAKSRAEDEYKESRDAILALFPGFEFDHDPQLKQKLHVKIAGKVRAIISARRRTNIDADLLMQAWPEAYEACKTFSEYEQVDPKSA